MDERRSEEARVSGKDEAKRAKAKNKDQAKQAKKQATAAKDEDKGPRNNNKNVKQTNETTAARPMSERKLQQRKDQKTNRQTSKVHRAKRRRGGKVRKRRRGGGSESTQMPYADGLVPDADEMGANAELASSKQQTTKRWSTKQRVMKNTV